MCEKQPYTPARISVLVPVYNVEKYLPRCMESILGQTLREIEVICVDDGSTDGSAAMLADYAAKDPRVRVVTLSENRGTLVARRECILHARGEYILWIDPDDILEPYACEELYAKASACGADIYHYLAEAFPDGDVDANGLRNMNMMLRRRGGTLRGREIMDGCFVEAQYLHNLCDKMFRTAICKKAAAYIGDDYMILSEDMLLYAMIAWFAQTYCGDQSQRQYYRYRWGVGVSTSQVCSLERFARILRSTPGSEKLRAFFVAVGAPEIHEGAIEYLAADEAGHISSCFNRVKDEEKDTAIALVADQRGTEAALDLLLRAYWQNAAQLQSVYHSWNFRIGAAVTRLPKAAVRLFKKLRAVLRR